ncbi:hypothetical protein TNCV_2205541 [Trichonephila clavipes]|nr:hypothetical protein TNCV_2205541 [Trichonephila clavipes]
MRTRPCVCVAFTVYRMSRYGVAKVSVGVGRRESRFNTEFWVSPLQLEPVRRCLDALEELEPLAMYQEDPPL